ALEGATPSRLSIREAMTCSSLPPPAAGAPPCKRRVSGATPGGGSAANTVGTTLTNRPRVRILPARRYRAVAQLGEQFAKSLRHSSLHFPAYQGAPLRAGYLIGKEKMDTANLLAAALRSTASSQFS